MKHIMISIKPEWTAKILNGEKTIEIRKSMPKCELPCKVYIYETKGKGFFVNCGRKRQDIGGKVVAEFTLNKITTHKKNYIDVEDNLCYNFLSEDVINAGFYSKQDDDYKKLDALCEFDYFVETYGNGKDLYAWHIDDLKIYDKPKELSEFYKGFKRKYYKNHFAQDIHKEKDALVQPHKCGYEYTYPLTKAPQSWCYVEGERK